MPRQFGCHVDKMTKNTATSTDMTKTSSFVVNRYEWWVCKMKDVMVNHLEGMIAAGTIAPSNSIFNDLNPDGFKGIIVVTVLRYWRMFVHLHKI